MDFPAIGIVLAELDGTGEGAGVAITGQKEDEWACNQSVVLERQPRRKRAEEPVSNGACTSESLAMIAFRRHCYHSDHNHDQLILPPASCLPANNQQCGGPFVAATRQ